MEVVFSFVCRCFTVDVMHTMNLDTCYTRHVQGLFQWCSATDATVTTMVFQFTPTSCSLVLGRGYWIVSCEILRLQYLCVEPGWSQHDWWQVWIGMMVACSNVRQTSSIRINESFWCVDAHLKRSILWYSGQFWFDSVAYCSSFNVVSIYACIVGTSYQCNEAFCRSDLFGVHQIISTDPHEEQGWRMWACKGTTVVAM